VDAGDLVNITEANAVNKVLRYLLGASTNRSEALDAAEELAERANKALSAGWTAADVRSRRYKALRPSKVQSLDDKGAF